MKRILITGGAGFIGQALVKRLADRHSVVVYDDFRRASPESRSFDGLDTVTVIHGDVRDSERLAAAVQGVDTVVHAAAIAGINTVDTDPVETMEVNFQGTANILAAARSAGISNRLVLLSTSEIFGPHAKHVTEDAPAVIGPATEQRWVYAASKLAGEHLAFAYQRSHALPIVVVRPFNVYGPGQRGEGAVKIFIENALTGNPLLVHGKGDQIRAWCYIDDFISGLLLCLTKKSAIGRSFNIGNPNTIATTLALAEQIIQITSSNSAIRFLPPRQQEIMVRIPDISQAKRVLGFLPLVDLESGIRSAARCLQRV